MYHQRFTLIIFLSLLLLSLGCTIYQEEPSLNDPSLNLKEKKVWVEIDPVACFGNPWEKSWFDDRKGESVNYPQDKNEQLSIITRYYENQGVIIYAGKILTYAEKPGGPIGVCESCGCPAGYTLYLQIAEEDLAWMLRAGHLYENRGLGDWTFKLSEGPPL